MCTYTVVEGNEDTDGIAIGRNALESGGKDLLGPAGQDANLDHAPLPANASHKVDGVKPTPTSASADATTLTLVWSEPLDTGSTPASAAFTVTVDAGTAPTVTAVSIDGNTATLTLSGALGRDEDVHPRICGPGERGDP